MKKLYLIRGIPGSGKSTLAQIIAAGHLSTGTRAVVCEADQFFTDKSGKYTFNPQQIPEEHKYCRDKTSDAMNEGISTVIVSNTSTEDWQMEPYKTLAEAYGYSIQEVLCLGNFKSIHEVPQETIIRMSLRLARSIINKLIGY